MMKRLWYMLALVAAFIGGCTEEDISIGLDQATDGINEPTIEDLLKEYIKGEYWCTRGDKMKINKVERRRYHLKEGDKKTCADTTAFDIAYVELEFEKTKGFACVSDDPRISQVLYFAREGSISDTSYIKPLKSLIEFLPEDGRMLIREYKTRDITSSTNEKITIADSKMRMNWGQNPPFNNYATSVHAPNVPNGEITNL